MLLSRVFLPCLAQYYTEIYGNMPTYTGTLSLGLTLELHQYRKVHSVLWIWLMNHGLLYIFTRTRMCKQL